MTDVRPAPNTLDPRRLEAVRLAEADVGPLDRVKLAAWWQLCGITPMPDPGKRWGQWCGVFVLAHLKLASIGEGATWHVGIGFIDPYKLPRIAVPEPGDVLYVNEPWRHHAIVRTVADGVAYTVDGNQPDVQMRHRKLDDRNITCFSIAPLLA